jgi:hypothetical protein
MKFLFGYAYSLCAPHYSEETRLSLCEFLYVCIRIHAHWILLALRNCQSLLSACSQYTIMKTQGLMARRYKGNDKSAENTLACDFNKRSGTYFWKGTASLLSLVVHLTNASINPHGPCKYKYPNVLNTPRTSFSPPRISESFAACTHISFAVTQIIDAMQYPEKKNRNQQAISQGVSFEPKIKVPDAKSDEADARS